MTFDANMLIAILIVIAALVIMFFVKRYVGSSTVKMLASIVSFVRNSLVSAGITSADTRFTKILDEIVQALTLVAADTDDSVPIGEKVDRAYAAFLTYATAAGLTFTDAEKDTLKIIISAGFSFMLTTGINQTKCKKVTAKLSHMDEKTRLNF